MRENVGRKDRMARTVAGPALMALGYGWWGGNRGDLPGLVAIVAGTTLVESAITRVCPLNALFGIDTRSPEEKREDLGKAQRYHRVQLSEDESSGRRAFG